LALAADYHRHACEPGGWNQREVGVEIESLRDRDMVPSQVLSQAKACPERFRSIQTAAKWKLRNVAQTIEKRSPPLNATQVKSECRLIYGTRQGCKLALAAASFKTVGH
jgi:hypothetical protein